MKVKFVLIIVIDLLLQSAIGQTKVIEPSLKDLILIPIDMGYGVKSGGDGVGNGAGPEKKLLIETEKHLPSQIKLCIKLGYCQNGPFLGQVLQNAEQEALIEFKTSSEEPKLQLSTRNERYFYTEDFVGSENTVNTSLLEVKEAQEAIRLILSIYARHYPNIADEQKLAEVKEFYFFTKDLVILNSHSPFGQSHLQVHLVGPKGVFVTDQDSHFPMTHFVCVDQVLRYEDFKIHSFFTGHAQATLAFDVNCHGNIRHGKLEITIYFSDQINWGDFYYNFNSYRLKIERIEWQNFIF